MPTLLTYGHDGSKDGGVVHGGAVPLLEPELVLALEDAFLRAAAHVHHVVGVEHAQLLLALGEPGDLAAQRHRRAEQQRIRRQHVPLVSAQTPGRNKIVNIAYQPGFVGFSSFE